MSGQADRTVDEVLRELSEKYGSLFNTESPARTKIPLNKTSRSPKTRSTRVMGPCFRSATVPFVFGKENVCWSAPSSPPLSTLLRCSSDPDPRSSSPALLVNVEDADIFK